MPPGIHVEETGAGRPLVALHGFGASTYTWREVIGVLAESHRVYAVDLKGSGRSIKPRDGRYSMRDQAALVLALIAERTLTGLTLVGHSFGGGVALLVALELVHTKPEALASLVLLDAPAYRQRLPAFIRTLRAPVIGPLLQWTTPVTRQVRTVLQIAYLNDRLIPDESVRAYAEPLGQPGGRQALRATALQIVPPDIDDISSTYPLINVPTLLIWGAHDKIVPREIGDRLHRAIGRSKFVVIEQAGHVPHEETPERVRPLLREFLAGAAPP